MPPPSEPGITPRGLLRILVRRRKAGMASLAVFLGLGAALALLRPLSYESQVILERKPVRITPQLGKQENEEFDVYRLTSESQRSVALLKSRTMMERWRDALGPAPASPEAKERELRRLYRSLTVRPVSYTDLFVIRVRARSPAEANRRAGLLVDSFARWDLELNRAAAKQLINLLQDRMAQVSRELSAGWERLKRLKGSQSLSLSGSSAARQMDIDLSARGKLYDNLTVELEEAERQMHTDLLPRTQALGPPTASADPVLSREQRLILAGCASVLGAVLVIFLFEWLSVLERGEENRPSWMQAS